MDDMSYKQVFKPVIKNLVDSNLFYKVSCFMPGGPSYFGGRNDRCPTYKGKGILIPGYGIGLLAIAGGLLLSCNVFFYLLYPSHLWTSIEGNPVRFYYRPSFLVVVCGLSFLLAGLTAASPPS